MARRKPCGLYPVRNLEEADQVMAQLGIVRRSLEELANEANAAIDRLKAEAETRAAPLRARTEALETGLLAFAEQHKDTLFAERRSRELTFGTLGYRRSSEVAPQPRWTWKRILARLRELGLAEALRVREEVNREELRRWPEERLELVGARRMEKDSFWYELSEQHVEGVS